MPEPFLDEETAQVLDWPAIWRAFQPVTVYGRAQKERLQPFLPGQEAALRAAQVQISADLAALPDTLTEQVVSLLQSLPDIRDAIDTLAHAGGALSAKHCLALKAFARGGLQLAERISDVLSDGPTVTAFERLLAPLGQAETPSFSVAHIAGEAYIQAGQQYATAVHRRTEAFRTRDAELLQAIGVSPNRDGQLVIALPQHRTLAEQLKLSHQVTWLRDTPFESVFEAVATEAMQAYADLTERAEAKMQAAADEAMRHLSDTLRAALPEWQRALKKMTEIDLRIAKVVLARRWQGCVAAEAESPQLQEAVHPLLAAAYAKQGRSYVPLDWHVAEGVNVLSGSNMGGKTLAMQLLCICQCLAQYGLPVPAKRFATRLYGAVRLCASADTEATSGLSSFGKEMTRLRETWPLLQSEAPVLVMFDEPGRSTNPLEGEALVIGLLKAAMHMKSAAVALVATHFAGTTKVPGVTQYRVRGLGDAALPSVVKDGSEAARLQLLAEAMDYRVEPVEAGTVATEGMRIARWLGVPEAVLGEAERFLAEQQRPSRQTGQTQTDDERGSHR